MNLQQVRLSVKPETNEIKIVGKGAMSGKVPTFESSKAVEKMHPLFVGSISDSVAVGEALTPYYDSLLDGFNKLKYALIESKNPKFNDYKPEIAQQKRYELIKPVLDEIDKTIADRFDQVQKGIEYANSMELAARELVEPINDISALRADFKAKEVRDAVTAMDMSERKEFINAAVQNQDMFILNALNDSYLPIIKTDPRAVDKAINHVVDERFPFVSETVSHFNEVSKGFTYRTQEFRTTQRKLASDYDINLDKLKRTVK